MTKRRLVLLVLLFFVYVILVWLLSFAFFPDSAFVVGLILTVCGLTLLLVFILISRVTSRLSSAPAQSSSSEPSPPVPRPTAARDDDLEAISSLIAEANDRLTKSPTLASGKVRPSVTALPLYLLLGTEGSGKTSLFVASELVPELLAGEVYRESAVVPTRVLNLWFAAGCVIGEPSGRFFSEDPGRLQRLIGVLLGKHGTSLFTRIVARRQPSQQLKGAILCCPIDAFKGVPDAARQAALVRRLQERLRAIGETLGMDFPVYVLFTKCDALDYFGEYFARLVESEDKQILGCTLPISAAGEHGRSELPADEQIKRLSEYFNRLYFSLAEQRTTFLRRETDRGRKQRIYEFPRELKRIRGTLVQFLVDVFRPNPLQPGPLLRGFYFTGTRKVPASESAATRTKFSQTGALGEATRLFRQEDLQKMSAPRPAAEDSALTAVWSFVPDVFRQIIVSDRDRVGGAFLDRKLDLYRRIVFGSIIFVCLLLSGFFIASWFGNHALLREAQEAAAAVKGFARAGDTPSQDNLLQIENLRSVLKKITYNSEHGTPWRLSFGLYAGNRVFPALHNLYFQRFREYFLDKTIRDVEAKLSSLPPTQNPAFEYKSVYNDLKGYSTITTSEEPRCSPDNEFAQWLMGSWRGTDLAERQFTFYVDELRAKRDPYVDLRSAPTAVKTARNYLAAYGGIEPLYQGIIAAVNQEAQGVARLSDYTQKAPETLVLKAGSEIPAAFTRTGWGLVQNRIVNAGSAKIGNPCVLGEAQSLGGLLQGSDTKRKLTNLYIREYIDRWKAFLTGTRVQGYKNHADAAHKLDVLSSNASPLLAVLAMTADNTKFPQNSASANALAQVKSNAKQNIIDRIRGRTPDLVKNVLPPSQPEETLGPEKILQVFQPTQAVFQAPNRNRLIDDVNTKYISALSDLQVAMNALAQQSDPDSNVELNGRANEKAQAASREAKQLALKFDSSPDGVGEVVANFLESPIRETEDLIVKDSRKPLITKIDGGARDVCGKLNSMLRKYPFNPQAERQEVEPHELEAMFKPSGGIFWSFHQANTFRLLELHGREWSLKPDADPKLNPRFLTFFNRMARISFALFPPDGNSPHMDYKLSVPPGQAFLSIKGTLEGEDFSGAAKQYSWPGQGGKQGVDLRVALTETINTPFARYEGFWGLFRWMQSAENRPASFPFFGFVNQRATGGGQPQPILENGSPIRIQVVEFPGKIDTAFDRNFFTGIDCPPKATQ